MTEEKRTIQRTTTTRNLTILRTITTLQGIRHLRAETEKITPRTAITTNTIATTKLDLSENRPRGLGAIMTTATTTMIIITITDATTLEGPGTGRPGTG